MNSTVTLALANTETENDTILINPDNEGDAEKAVWEIFSEDEAEWNRIADAKLAEIGIRRTSDWDRDGNATGIRI